MQGLKGLKQGKFHHLDAWNHTLEAYRILEEGCRTGLVQMSPWDRELKEWLDKPEDVVPSEHSCVESQLPWYAFDDGLPRRRCDELPDLVAAWSAPET